MGAAVAYVSVLATDPIKRGARQGANRLSVLHSDQPAGHDETQRYHPAEVDRI
jgi:hypothetical protein